MSLRSQRDSRYQDTEAHYSQEDEEIDGIEVILEDRLKQKLDNLEDEPSSDDPDSAIKKSKKEEEDLQAEQEQIELEESNYSGSKQVPYAQDGLSEIDLFKNDD